MGLSEKEQARRHKALREDMAQQGLDLLIIYGIGGRSGRHTNNLAYVSNFFPYSAGDQVLVFPLEGEPALFVGVDNIRIEAMRTGWVKDVRCNPKSSALAELVAHIKETYGAGQRIGISSLQIMPAAWYERLREQVPAKEWVEAGDLIWKRRLVKSAEEIELMRRAAGVADQMWEGLLQFVKEGASEIEMRMEMDRIMFSAGALDQFNVVSMGSMENGGEAPWGYVIPPTTRRIQRGDAAMFEITPRLTEGYWNQIVRVLTLGPPEKWLVDSYDAVREARDESLKHLRAGESMGEMVRVMRRVIEARGYEMWPFGLMHLCGLDAGEFQATEGSKIVFEPGMTVVVHPLLVLGPNRQLFWGESYLVTESGCECINHCSDALAVL